MGDNLMEILEMKSLKEEWKEDCIHHHDRVLTGKYAHWCPEFDYLPIDETIDEFEYCLCEFDENTL
jgi:hypothetical protein